MARNLQTTIAVALLAALLVLLPSTLASYDETGFCKMSQKAMEACRPAMTIGADPAMPVADDCCTALKGANMPCLCAQRANPMIKYFGIDPKLALNLPSKCNVGPADPCKGGPLAFYKGFVPNFGRLGRIMECDHVLNFGTGEKTFCKGGAKSTYPPEKQHKGVELLMKFFS
ncbi:hypothetical protein J5N97_019866 [Dioscorea zingiberensis]|uniref:Bifunctional inhibitor/plant lipid transfer protein/seed storage helical domain-containing protein n=1 Tax=Dioscorea zingiberensis TaxID=325984 RepID=A0A9D5CFV7_9LILI|nr:hypothetical protein J5N97_019866 [Dioscorea zingiberensis]